jgi:hypothetical protein
MDSGVGCELEANESWAGAGGSAQLRHSEAEAGRGLGAHGVGALVLVDEVGEVGPEACSIDAGDPGDGLAGVGLAEAGVVAQMGAGDGVLLGEAEDVGEGDVVPDEPGFGKVVDAKGFDKAEVPGFVLLQEPGADGAALGQVLTGVVEGHDKIPAADAGRADDQGDAGVEDDLFGMDVVLDVELAAVGFVDEAHLHDADAIDDGWIGEDSRGGVGAGADDEDGQGSGPGEAVRGLEEKGDGGTGARGVSVLQGQAAAFDEGRMRGHLEAVLDDVSEDAEGGPAGGCGDGGSVRRHDAEDVEAGLEEEVGDGPLVVDLVADVGGEDDGNSGFGCLDDRDAGDKQEDDQSCGAFPSMHAGHSGCAGALL